MSTPTSNNSEFQQLERIFVQCKNAIANESYETALAETQVLRDLLTSLLSSDHFDNELFLKDDAHSLAQRQLLVSLDKFFNEDVTLLTKAADDIKKKLGQASIGNKMNKAYTG